MTDYVEIIPAYDQRQAFARWSLAQQPGGLPMATHEAWTVPAPLFTEVPSELLEGAYIDGRLFRPALAGFEPHGAGYRKVGESEQAETPGPAEPPVKKTQRRRAPQHRNGDAGA